MIIIIGNREKGAAIIVKPVTKNIKINDNIANLGNTVRSNLRKKKIVDNYVIIIIVQLLSI